MDIEDDVVINSGFNWARFIIIGIFDAMLIAIATVFVVAVIHFI